MNGHIRFMNHISLQKNISNYLTIMVKSLLRVQEAIIRIIEQVKL